MAEQPKDQPLVRTMGVTGSPSAEVFEAFNRAMRIIASLPDVSPPVEAVVGADGKLPIPGAVLRANVNVSASVNEVSQLDFTNFAEGRRVEIELFSASAPLTFNHLAYDGLQPGEMELPNNLNINLNDVAQRLVFEHRVIAGAHRAVLVKRYNFESAISSFLNDINANRKAITNYRRIGRASSTTVVVTLDDRGKIIRCTGAAVTLPTDPTGWDLDDEVVFLQMAADLIFAPSTAIINPYGHDRGFGLGARMVASVYDTTNPMKWTVQGAMKGPPAGGVLVERTFVSHLVTTTVVTDLNSTAYKLAAAVTHTPAANSNWLYFTFGAFGGAPNNFDNRSKARLKALTDSDGPKSTHARYSGMAETVGLILGKNYGATPGSQTIELAVASGSTANGVSTQIVAPGIVGLKLEADEFLSLMSAPVATANPHNTAVDAHSFTTTTLADDYVLLVFGSWVSGSGAEGGVVSFTVDGVEHVTWDRTKDGLNYGSTAHIYPISNLTAASHTFKIRIRGRISTSSMTMESGGVALLKKSRFQEWNTALTEPETSDSNATYQTRVSLSPVLASGWDYLILATTGLANSVGDAVAGGTKAKLLRNTNDFSQEVVSVPRLNSTYNSTAVLLGWLARGAGSAETFALQWAIRRTSDIAYIADSAMLVLPLKKQV